MATPNGNTMIIRWGLGVLGTGFVMILMFIATSFSGDLKKLEEANTTAQTEIGIMRTMVDNIQEDVREIKQAVKESQKRDEKLHNNLVQIKQIIMEAELRRAREKSTSLPSRFNPTP